MQSETVEQMNAQISRDEIRTAFEIVNRIWEQARIRFSVESIVTIEAHTLDEADYAAAFEGPTRRSGQSIVRTSCLPEPFPDNVANLCVVGQFPMDLFGVYYPMYGNRFPLVAWPTHIEGGRNIKPAVLAHEFGHFLGLPHNSELDIYLMRGEGNNFRRSGRYEEVLLLPSETSAARRSAQRFIQLASE